MKWITDKQTGRLLGAALALCLQAKAWAGISAGQRIGVDIGDASGVITNWTLLTSVNGPAVNALNLTNGSVLPGVTVALTTSSGGGGVNDLSGTALGNNIVTMPHAVTDDGAWAYDPAGATLSLNFTGLDPALMYQVELVSIGTYTPVDTPFINGIPTNWPAGCETRALRKTQTSGVVYSNLVAVGGTLSLGVRDVNPVISGAILTAVAVVQPEAVSTAEWGRTMTIQTAGYSGAASLTNFPLPVALHPGALNGFSYAGLVADGRDLRFTDAGNSVVLTHEIELWKTNGTSQVWVRVPVLNSNTVIRAFWGNPAATNRPTPQTWDSDFRGVWHLGAGLGDATTNRNTGTNTGTTIAAGRAGDGRAFDGTSYVDCGNSASLNPTNNRLTLSAWINPTLLSGNAIVSKSFYSTHTDPYYTWILYAYSGGLHCRLDGSAITAGALSVGQWQHVAATYDGSSIRLYVNGVQTGSTPKTGNLQATSRNVRIGGRDTGSLGEFFHGAIDEVRVSSVARSADWIRAEWGAAVTNSAFCTFGNVEFTRPTLPVVANPMGATNILTSSATLTGLSQSTGAAPTTVWFCWGTADSGTNFASWILRTNLGVRSAGVFSSIVTGLVTEVPCYYRCRASNSFGEAWSAAQVFTPAAPRLSIADGQIQEGNSGQSLMQFRVTLSYPYPGPVTFGYATAYGTADAADFTAAAGQITIPASQTEGFISVAVNGDVTLESDELFHVNLTTASNAVIARAQAQGVIFDDDRADYLSPVALAADTLRGLVYVAHQTGRRVGVVDAAGNQLLSTIVLPDSPNGITLSPDGSKLYVTAGVSEGRVYVIDATSRTILETFAVGHTPIAPVVSPDGARLYVCNRFNNDVSVIALPAGTTVARIPVDREPHAAALTPDGGRLLVANLLPSGPATSPTVASVVSIIATASNAVIGQVRLPFGSHSLRGMCVSTNGSRAYVTHILSRFYVPTTQVTRGWMNTAALSVIDVTTGQLINTVLLDDLDLGAANPWGVACSADNQFICVAHAGTHEVSVIDQAGLLARLKAGGTDVPQDLTYLATLRRRLPLKGMGPRGIALIGNQLYAAEYYSDTVGSVNIAPGNEYSAQEIAVGWRKPVDLVRQGEINYNDAKLCLQQWQSCASCHPDARADSLNWDLLNDGFGTPKNTKSHVYSWQTPPAMVTGIRANAGVAVRSGLKFIEFVNQPESCALAIDAYLQSLQATPSPYLTHGALSAAAVRGQGYFQSSGCANCHSGPYLTDQQKHNIGTGVGREAGWEYDTPTLRELWRTAPYIHDGRAATVREVVTTVHASRTAGLNETQINELVEYLLSL